MVEVKTHSKGIVRWERVKLFYSNYLQASLSVHSWSKSLENKIIIATQDSASRPTTTKKPDKDGFG
jgi:hypothetical protein